MPSDFLFYCRISLNLLPLHAGLSLISGSASQGNRESLLARHLIKETVTEPFPHSYRLLIDRWARHPPFLWFADIVSAELRRPVIVFRTAVPKNEKLTFQKNRKKERR
jgi:hypothetical protein